MTWFPNQLVAIGGVCVLLVASGCKPYKLPGAAMPSSNPSAVSVVEEKPSLTADPDEPAVKSVVEQALAARIRGDAEALKKLCEPHLAAKFDSLQPRQLEFEIRKIEVLSHKAQVKVWTRDPAFDPRDNQSIVTYDLVRQADTWRISNFRVATFTDHLTPQLLESK